LFSEEINENRGQLKRKTHGRPFLDETLVKKALIRFVFR
jgi:hypothetical protein